MAKYMRKQFLLQKQDTKLLVGKVVLVVRSSEQLITINLFENIGFDHAVLLTKVNNEVVQSTINLELTTNNTLKCTLNDDIDLTDGVGLAFIKGHKVAMVSSFIDSPITQFISFEALSVPKKDANPVGSVIGQSDDKAVLHSDTNKVTHDNKGFDTKEHKSVSTKKENEVKVSLSNDDVNEEAVNIESVSKSNNESVKKSKSSKKVNLPLQDDIKPNTKNNKINESSKSIKETRKIRLTDFNQKTNNPISIIKKLNDEVSELSRLLEASDETISKNAIAKAKLHADNSKKMDQLIKYNEKATLYTTNIIYEKTKWVKISFADLSILHEKYWKVFFDSLIINSITKYGFLLLGVDKNSINDDNIYYLAVRSTYKNGVFYESKDLGVIDFLPINDGTLTYTTDGYWIINII